MAELKVVTTAKRKEVCGLVEERSSGAGRHVDAYWLEQREALDEFVGYAVDAILGGGS